MNRYWKITNFDEDRLKGIGSSELPILSNMTSKFQSREYEAKSGEIVKLQQTPLTLWKVKTRRVRQVQPHGGPTGWGHNLEGIVLREWIRGWRPDDADKFYLNYLRGKSYGPYKIMTECVHPKYKFMLSHADLVVDEGTISDPFGVEAKTTTFHGGKRREGQVFDGYDEDDTSQHGIPDRTFIQVQGQEFVYDYFESHLPVLINTSDYRTYGPIVADPKVQEKLLALAERFWWHVEHDKEPQPTTWDDVVSLNPTMSDTTAIVGGDEEMKVREMIARAEAIKARQKAQEVELDDIKNAIGILIGANAVLASTEGEPLAKAAERQRESVALLAEVNKIKKRAEVTPEEKELLDIDARLRELGLVKVSQWREVRY